MKILNVLKLFILYFSLAGITVECSWWSIIADGLQVLKSLNDTEEIHYKIPCGVSKYNSFESKIVGGTECTRNEFPWIASLQIKIKRQFQHTCGCTVIHQSFVLTAGHCVDGRNPKNLQVVVGINNVKMDTNSENRQSRKVKEIYVNNYNPENLKNDIAIAELVTPLQLIEGIVVPICIPRGSEVFYGEPVAAGWGRIIEDGSLPDVCQKVQLNLLNTTVCADIYNKMGYNELVHNCQICTLTKNKDTCQGDSGGCLMFQDANKKTFAGGIVSWGAGCARPGNPGVFAQTSCYASWIIKTVNRK